MNANLSRLQRWWNAYWFPTTSTLNLAGARIVAVAAEVFWLFPGLAGQINLLTKNQQFSDPQPLVRFLAAVLPRDLIFSPGSFTVIYWVSMIAGVAALVGLATRLSLFLLTFGLWFFVSHLYSYADVHHPQVPFAFFLLALSLSPAGASLSFDALLRRRRIGTNSSTDERSDMAMWPLKLAHVFLSMTYFSTGITKLLSGGLAWMNGYTLQNCIFTDGINRGIPLGIWLAQQRTICVLLGVGTIAFETFYFVSLLVPRIAPWIFAGGILFHLGLYFISGHPFFEHILLNGILLLFLDPNWFPAQWRKLTSGARSPAPVGQSA
jgi:hypothetical protein